MQEDINRQSISLCIRGGKISAEILKKSLQYAAKEIDKQKAKMQAKSNEKEAAPPRGKQTLSDLTGQTDKLTNIKITPQNIGSFDRVARKYDIDYALKKDTSEKPPVYYVFFKAKDVDVMNLAFKEYTAKVTDLQKRPSICAKLRKAMETVKNTISQQKVRHKVSDRSR